jgi:hypothetical protein
VKCRIVDLFWKSNGRPNHFVKSTGRYGVNFGVKEEAKLFDTEQKANEFINKYVRRDYRDVLMVESTE